MTYQARPAQHAILQGRSRTARHQVVASMGVGKTGSAMLYTGGLELQYGRWPGLFVLAPLQVCYSWQTEVPNWRPDLRVSLIAGTAEQRKAALMQDADVYLMNYENLPWLEKTGPANWGDLAQHMVADESTRLRGTRVHIQTSSLGKRTLVTANSGVQTGALARHAGDFAHWTNQTGTPCPNGVLDWWPQMWFIDGGHRLGNSFTAFENRWFMKPVQGGEFAKPVPMPGAVEDITSRIRDVTTVVRTEDYFDLQAPNVVNVNVALPEKVMAQYRSMRNKMFMEIEQGMARRSITALSAASKVAKLLQIAAGWIYHRDEELDPDLQLCEELHTAKLEAVESILNETDEPLVVFYHHKATVQMMHKRFKKRMRELGTTPNDQADWNAGKIEILACQYQRGGMGLSLQHGGRNICFIEPTYRADDYEQAIERLGPLRQMQSGYQRTVNVFHILAHGTEDSNVYAKLVAKIDLQDMVIDLLQK